MRSRMFLAMTVAIGGCGRLAFDIPPGADAPSPGDVPAVVPCTEGDLRVEASGHCYSAWSAALSYPAAGAACAGFGAHLVTIADLAENDVVRTLVNEATWIGFDDLVEEGVFAWIDGEPVTFTAWQSQEPNDAGPGEDCAVLADSTGGWNDIECPEPHAYICEREPT